MTGLERNSDIVFAASYAPLLQVRLWHCPRLAAGTAVLTSLAACQLDSMGASLSCL